MLSLGVVPPLWDLTVQYAGDCGFTSGPCVRCAFCLQCFPSVFSSQLKGGFFLPTVVPSCASLYLTFILPIILLLCLLFVLLNLNVSLLRTGLCLRTVVSWCQLRCWSHSQGVKCLLTTFSSAPWTQNSV